MKNKQEPDATESMKKKLKPNYGKEDFTSAIKEKDLGKLKEIIEYFKENKQDLASVIKCNHQSKNDCILQFAALTKNIETIELLLKNVACTEDKNIQDCLIHEAVKMNDLSLLNICIERGFLHHSVCNHRKSPLFELIALRRSKWIEIFHREGVSFEQKTKNGMPLLHFALSRSETSKALIKLLLYCGAKLSDRNNDDLTPLHYVLTKKVSRSKRAKARFIKLFLKYGSDVNCWSKTKEETVLHTAVKNKKSVNLLLMYGADVNLKDSKNYTAFRHCVHRYSRKLFDEADNFLCAIDLFMRQLFKLQVLGKFIDPQIVRLKKILNRLYAPLMSELQKGCNVNIVQGIDLQDIIMGNENSLTNIMKNPEICKFLASPKIDCCRVWKSVLKFQSKKGMERQILINKCKEPFMRALQWKIHVIATYEIFNYLSRTDLRSLYAACYPSSFMEKLIPKQIKNNEHDKDDETSGSSEFEEESDSNDEEKSELSEDYFGSDEDEEESDSSDEEESELSEDYFGNNDFDNYLENEVSEDSEDSEDSSEHNESDTSSIESDSSNILDEMLNLQFL